MNRKLLNSHQLASAMRQSRSSWAAPVAFLATLLALPVSAGVSIPDEPLTTGTRVPPNILFILDDSGSMAWRNMNNGDIATISGTGFSSSADANGVTDGTSYSSESTADAAMYMQNYVTNSLYYNPAVTYQPWMGSDGNRLTGGTSYTAVYSSDHYVSNDGNGSSGGSRNLSSNTQTYYVPKDVNSTDTTYLSNVANYYRYQIPAGGTDFQRGVFGTAIIVDTTPADTRPTGYPQTVSYTAGTGNTVLYSFTVPAGLDRIVITTSGGNHGNNSPNWTNGSGNGVNLYVDDDNNVTNNPSCSDSGNGNDESCTINNPAAGTWYVGLYTASRYKNVSFDVVFKYPYTYTSNRCDGGDATGQAWIDCATSATPTGRTLDAEKTNFATWYSYYRTRIKAAKAGAAEAFKSLGNKVRVGYRSLHANGSANFDIPITDGNEGRFVNNTDDPGTPANEATTTRTTWYRRLFGAQANNGTPLQTALNSAGSYFSSTSTTGPYGHVSNGSPVAAASQYSCRQNFTILTTDGYWNTSTVDVGDADSSSGTQITGPKNDPYTYSPTAPYMDSRSQTLADIAMYYWKRDLRTLSNNVPTTASNPAFWQHMVTFGISIGLKTTRGWSNIGDVPSDATWPAPGSDRAANIDDLLHAAVNGHGAFVSASSPSEFTAGLSQALASIQQRTSSYSNVATNSVSLDAGSQVFNASYVSGIWTGKITARALSKTGVSDVERNFTIPALGSRNVFTSNGSAGSNFPTSAQEAALLRTGGPVDYPVTGAQNANYLKGDASQEERNNGLLRSRPTTVLGDVVGSSPAYVKDTDTLYVGANDGMLHAFNATSGSEVFAYVPNIINFNYLATLSRGDYTHKFFVDGPIVVSNRNQTAGENILVGALGKGGKGVYSLNVGTPDTATASGLFNWERAETTGNNMGLVLGKPIIGKVPGGQTAVIFGNGVNSTNEKAVLIVLNLDTGAVISEIDTGVGSSAAPNGLSAPVGVYGQDGKTLETVYAGDMQGNVWKFNLTAGTATKLFAAVGPTGNVQPISGGIAVAIHPITKKRWVFFGTGRFLTTGDADTTSTATQSMYGFEDTGTTLTRSNLQSRGAPTVSGNVRTFQAKAPLPSGMKGWYIDLTTSSGERIVQDAQVVSTFLVTASMVPTGDACEADGTGYINALDAFTGTSAGGSYFDQNRNGDTTDDTAGGIPVGSINAGVGMPTLPNLLRGLLIVGGTAGDDLGDPATLSLSWDRVSWREIRLD